jgi:hypothetical protein
MKNSLGLVLKAEMVYGPNNRLENQHNTERLVPTAELEYAEQAHVISKQNNRLVENTTRLTPDCSLSEYISHYNHTQDMYTATDILNKKIR